VKHLKPIKLFESLDTVDILKDILNLYREGYYSKSNDQTIVLKEITDIIKIRKKMEEIFENNSVFSTYLDRFHISYKFIIDRDNIITINIKEVEDEWLYVDIFLSNHNIFNCFKCDQQEGLFAFLLDFKKILDKYKLI
jgi:hypothetical protein